MRTETPPVYTEIAAIRERIAAGGPPPAHTAACARCQTDLGPVDTHAQAVEVVLDCGGRVDPDGSLVCPECVEDEHLEDTMTNTVELPIGTTTDGTPVSWALDSHGLIYGHTGTGKTRTLAHLAAHARARGAHVFHVDGGCQVSAAPTDLAQAQPLLVLVDGTEPLRVAAPAWLRLLHATTDVTVIAAVDSLRATDLGGTQLRDLLAGQYLVLATPTRGQRSIAEAVLEGYTPEGHSAGQGVYGRAGETVPVTVHPPALP